MSGHSKWAGIKHKKAIVDAQRNKVFSKIIRELTVAARSGGNPDTNPRLRLVVSKARDANMPKDNIEKAIKRGTGELPGVHYEDMVMEGYGPGGVAIYIEALSDNKNRTSSALKNVLDQHGGSPAGAGSVSWLFAKKGYITVNKNAATEDDVMTVALDHGAEDFATEGDSYIITTPLAKFDEVKTALQAANLTPESAQITMVPSNHVKVEGDAARKVLALVEALEDLDDVQNVYANFDIPDAILQEALKS